MSYKLSYCFHFHKFNRNESLCQQEIRRPNLQNWMLIIESFTRNSSEKRHGKEKYKNESIDFHLTAVYTVNEFADIREWWDEHG